MQCLSCSGCLKCSIVDLGVRMNCFCCVWLHDLLALWSWTNYLCILSPNFCIYKMASHLVLRLVWWLCQCLACLALPSCSLSIWHNHPWGVSLYTCGLTLRDFLGGSPPSSSVCGISEARMMDWVTFPSPGKPPYVCEGSQQFLLCELGQGVC